MNILVIIPARGGSKGIPRKNIKQLHHKPLIYYTIEAAQQVFKNQDICISTDDIEIKTLVEKLGIEVPFLRPPELATDTAGTYEVLLHAIDFYEKQDKIYDSIVLLQPTSPFRNAQHIEEAIALYTNDLDMVVSVKETAANPYYVLFEENEKGYLEKSKKGNFTRRQDCPKVYEYNGAIYVINIKSLKKAPRHLLKNIKKYVMDEEVSLDIDTPFDWIIAELLMAQKEKNEREST